MIMRPSSGDAGSLSFLSSAVREIPAGSAIWELLTRLFVVSAMVYIFRISIIAPLWRTVTVLSVPKGVGSRSVRLYEMRNLERPSIGPAQQGPSLRSPILSRS